MTTCLLRYGDQEHLQAEVLLIFHVGRKKTRKGWRSETENRRRGESEPAKQNRSSEEGENWGRTSLCLPSPIPRFPVSSPEEAFLKAIKIARRQQAKSLELRATTSLARLWQQQGKQKQAHGMLAKVYHWFTEGFDTKDLQETKTLIEELSQ